MKDGVFLPLRWENPNAMAYAKLGPSISMLEDSGCYPAMGGCLGLFTEEGPVPRSTRPGGRVQKRGVRERSTWKK